MPSYLKYRQRLTHALDADNDEDITWITVRGRHIPIKEGQSKGEAIREAFNKSGENAQKTDTKKSENGSSGQQATRATKEKTAKNGGESKSEGAKKEFMSKEEYSKVLKNVQPILKKAVKSEPQITKDLQSIKGIKLVGLDYRLKKEKSAVEKVKRERIEKGAEYDSWSDREIMDNMWDLVRYTQQVEKGSFVEQAQKTLDTLKKKGYKIHQLKNFWRPEVNKGTNPYRGINVKLLSPDGQKVELQFNTENNMKVKERMHEIYNKQRELKPDSKEYQALNKESLKLTKEFDNPKGIEKLVG